MKALISPNEQIETGYRVAEVEPDEKVFDVAQPLFWVDCPADIEADKYWFNPENGQFVLVPPKPAA